jgi:hypothetical protein
MSPGQPPHMLMGQGRVATSADQLENSAGHPFHPEGYESEDECAELQRKCLPLVQYGCGLVGGDQPTDIQLAQLWEGGPEVVHILLQVKSSLVKLGCSQRGLNLDTKGVSI